jgi:hypothetical protein
MGKSCASESLRLPQKAVRTVLIVISYSCPSWDPKLDSSVDPPAGTAIIGHFYWLPQSSWSNENAGILLAWRSADRFTKADAAKSGWDALIARTTPLPMRPGLANPQSSAALIFKMHTVPCTWLPPPDLVSVNTHCATMLQRKGLSTISNVGCPFSVRRTQTRPGSFPDCARPSGFHRDRSYVKWRISVGSPDIGVRGHADPQSYRLVSRYLGFSS